MVISNWVEKKLEERRIRREDAIRAEGREEGREEGRAEGRVEGREEGRVEGREEGFERGRAYERKRIADEVNGKGFDVPPSENKE